MSVKFLMIDDNEDVLLAARLLLKQHFDVIQQNKTLKKSRIVLKNESYDVILLDMNFTRDMTSGQEEFSGWNRCREHDPSAVVILDAAYGDVELAVQAIKAGAADFCDKTLAE